MNTFWTLWVFNAVMSLIPVYFFLVGISDGTVSSRNIGIWLLLLLAVAIVIGGSLLLKTANQMGIAKALLIIAAIPGVIAILFFLVLLISNPRWN